MTARVIDVESTGVDPAKDAIIEIASVDLVRGEDGTIGIGNPMATYVDPERPIPPQSSAIHHILGEDVNGAPKLDAALEPFRGAQAYIAHNAEFEKGFLGSHLGCDPIWLCTFKCALLLFPDFVSHSNQALRYELGLASPFGQDRHSIVPHRADSDVVVTAAILVEMLKTTPWAQLVAWSQEPALFTRFNFGKHRGERFDAHPDYCEWVLRQADMDAGVRFSAEYWLKRREAA